MHIGIDNFEALAAVLLAGSLLMERFVTIVKTLVPSWFGAPGPDPDAIYRSTSIPMTQRVDPEGDWLDHLPTGRIRDLLERIRPRLKPARWRRIRVLGIVLGASGLAASLLSHDGVNSLLSVQRSVAYGVDGDVQRMHWMLFALLISGGSAFWTQMLGAAGAIKDARAAQAETIKPEVLVVNRADTPRFEARNE